MHRAGGSYSPDRPTFFYQCSPIGLPCQAHLGYFGKLFWEPNGACANGYSWATMVVVLVHGEMRVSTFAERLKQLREAAGLTQSELAERAGMNRFGVAKLEQGVREPSWATVQVLAEALGVDCAAFQAKPQPEAATKEPRGRGKK